MGNPRARVCLSPLSHTVAAGDLSPGAQEDPPWHCLSLRLLPPAFAGENTDKGAAVEVFVSTSCCCPAPLCPCGMGTSCRQWEQSRDSYNSAMGPTVVGVAPKTSPNPGAGSYWRPGFGGSLAGHAPSPCSVYPHRAPRAQRLSQDLCAIPCSALRRIIPAGLRRCQRSWLLCKAPGSRCAAAQPHPPLTPRHRGHF